MISRKANLVSNDLDEQIGELNSALNNIPALGRWFNNTLNQKGYYTLDGIVSPSQNFKCGLVDISGIGATRLFSYNNIDNKTAKVCFFDVNNALISHDRIYSGLHTYTIPENTVYIGLSASNAAKNCFFLDTGLITDIQDTVTDIQDTVTDMLMIDVGTMISGYFISSINGQQSSITDSDCTDYIAVIPEIDIFVEKAFARGHRAGVAEYNSDKVFIRCLWTEDSENTSKNIILSSDTAFIRITAKAGEVPTVSIPFISNIKQIKTSIADQISLVGQILITDNVLVAAGYYTLDGIVSQSANWSHALVDISNRGDDTIYIVGSTVENNTAKICFFDSVNTLISSEAYKLSGYGYAIPQGTVYVGLSLKNTDENCNYIIKGKLVTVGNGNSEGGGKTLYVAPNGSDANSGLSKTVPLATVNAALSKAANVVLLASGVYEQTIDLSIAEADRITLKRDDRNQDTITFVDPNRLICSSAALVSGTTKVYSAVANRTVDTECTWIYQDGYADRATLITDAERMPQQRGYEYRCEDTKIDLCLSNTLEAAITEIENSESYKWFYDSENQMVYFSAPSNDFIQYPICGSRGAALFSNSKQVELTMIGIDVKYMYVNLTGLTGARISNCKCTNAYSGGAFQYNYGVDIKFEHCEAARASRTRSLGDGFNAHGANSSLSVPARNCMGVLIDCWSHDNMDDGFSDHERSESLIIGGLYEYNGDGVTPSSGSHCTCYGVYSRNNKHGIYYTIASGASDRGVGGQVYCVGCVTENNSVSGYLVEGSNNKMILNNCKSIGNAVGYQATSNNEMILIDCGTLNDRTIKTGSGTITIKNTSLVE